MKFYYTNETYEVLFTDKTLITTQLSEDIVIDDITFETNEEEEEEIHTDMEDNADEEEDIDPQLDVDDMNYIVGKVCESPGVHVVYKIPLIVSFFHLDGVILIARLLPEFENYSQISK